MVTMLCLGVKYPLEVIGSFRNFEVGDEVDISGYPNFLKKIKGFDSQKRWLVVSLIDLKTGKEVGDEILIDESDILIPNKGLVKPFEGVDEIARVRILKKVGNLEKTIRWSRHKIGVIARMADESYFISRIRTFF